MTETIQFSLLGKRFAIKKALIVMKLCYFTYNFGAALIFPFIPLQMTDLGLTIEDIGYIYGLYPLITMFSGPISGGPRQDRRREFLDLTVLGTFLSPRIAQQLHTSNRSQS